MFYLFKGNKALQEYEATIGRSVVNGTYHLCGPIFDLFEQDGRLSLVKDGVRIAYTSQLIAKTVFSGIAAEAPIRKAFNGWDFSATEMLVYKTQNGSIYTFIPVDASVNLV